MFKVQSKSRILFSFKAERQQREIIFRVTHAHFEHIAQFNDFLIDFLAQHQ